MASSVIVISSEDEAIQVSSGDEDVIMVDELSSDITLAEDPKGLKVKLMLHQKRALSWLMWRENQKPAGGILADDTGLGKTLTIISLILATIDLENEDNASESETEGLEKSSKGAIKKSSKYKVSSGTLVICPANLIKQWKCEIEKRLKRNLLSTELYHEDKRESRASRLAKYDVVITTYNMVQDEFEKNGPLYNIKWKRVILDEAHIIHNLKYETIYAFKAKYRWAITSIPVHNNELDLYVLIKFLQCSPFDDLAVWKRWVANKSAAGQDRLNKFITSILLRRTKHQLQEPLQTNAQTSKLFVEEEKVKNMVIDHGRQEKSQSTTNSDENTLAEDPKGLKVDLMHHQKQALAWLMWRENQKPAGGILADDMGLGKTLTMISLILATKDSEVEDDASDSETEGLEKSSKGTIKKSSKYKVSGGTLVICPATLIKQWQYEIEKWLKRNVLSTDLFHGDRREFSASRLAKYDVVITTYKLARGEFEKNGLLFNIEWKRVIVDEAHVIRNSKTQTSIAICALKAKSRWALTGTPVHNTALDMYALLKFVRCSPLDDLAVWKRWVANKSAEGQDRLNTVINSILLRTTKYELQEQGALQKLPTKKLETIQVSLDSTEKEIYQKVLIFSRSLFIEYLQQRAEKNPDFTIAKNITQTYDEQYTKMHKKVIQMYGNTEVKCHEILVLLLRLRQICCHPSLISSMLDRADCAAEGIEDDEDVDMAILDKLNNLNLDDETPVTESGETGSFSSAANKILSYSNPVFAENRPNEKLRIIQKIIEEKVIPNGDKIIIVSQWISMLNIIMCHLREVKIKCDILDGKIRNDIVLDFNNPSTNNKVLLLSLAAGGIDLNLVGANHLLLVDLHWNPQLECQAQDRIYRLGQKKTVYIYKLVTSDTIEERIKALQDRKMNLASDLLSGVRPGAGNKLTLDDLKMLFNVDN